MFLPNICFVMTMRGSGGAKANVPLVWNRGTHQGLDYIVVMNTTIKECISLLYSRHID